MSAQQKCNSIQEIVKKLQGGKRINITRELQLLQVLKVYLKWEKRFSEEV